MRTSATASVAIPQGFGAVSWTGRRFSWRVPNIRGIATPGCGLVRNDSYIRFAPLQTPICWFADKSRYAHSTKYNGYLNTRFERFYGTSRLKKTGADDPAGCGSLGHDRPDGIRFRPCRFVSEAPPAVSWRRDRPGGRSLRWYGCMLLRMKGGHAPTEGLRRTASGADLRGSPLAFFSKME